MESSAASAGGFELVGREDLLEAIDRFLDARPGEARALVLEGEPGIGKTALWEAAARSARARGLHVLESRATREEAQLGFAALADLLDGLDPALLARLPDPQRRGLEAALLLREPDRAGDARAAAAGLLGVLRELAGAAPHVIATDDVAWLDPPSHDALAFAARRLREVPVRLLLTRRPPSAQAPAIERAVASERLPVTPLSFGAVTRLWRVRLGASFVRPVARRLYDACGGNALFALELARAVEELGGQVALGENVPLPAAVEVALGARLESITPAVREAVMAVELGGAASAAQLAQVVDVTALDAALDADLLRREGGRLRLAHPLFGAAAAARSGIAERRALHLRLAATAAEEERRALHLAMATAEPDEPVAAVVAAAAEHALVRGSMATAADLGEHALRLTAPDSPQWTERLLTAARYQVAAGNLVRLNELIAPALGALAPGSARARALLLLADGVTADVGEVEDYARRALDDADGEPLLRSRALSILATAHGIARVRDVRAALADAEEAVLLGCEAGDPRAELGGLTRAMWMRHLLGESSEDLRDRTGALERDYPPLARDSARRAEAVRLTWRGELGAARALLLALRRQAELNGEAESEFVIRLQLSELSLRAAEWPAVAELLDEWSHQQDHAMGAPVAHLRISAQLAAGRGEVDEARELATRAIDAALAIDSHWHRLEALRARGLAALLAEDLAAAVADLDAVWQHTREQQL
ncbi:MAG TPA: ATP-binding protein, partial [Solirubrobacteraceae bacterium]|nr:ATP-binding protein [Solirubrobacteraceae bacterium]